MQGLLIEGANPRHAHEWAVFRDHKLPDDKMLIPGVISSTTNYIEHPLLVAERICRYADLVGRERVIAGSDCGFGTFAGFGPVDPDVAYLKLDCAGRGRADRIAIGCGAGIDVRHSAMRSADERVSFDVRGARLRCAHGRRRVRRCCLVHGWALDLDMWRPQFAALADRYRLIAFDRRGFGLSIGHARIERRCR